MKKKKKLVTRQRATAAMSQKQVTVTTDFSKGTAWNQMPSYIVSNTDVKKFELHKESFSHLS